MAWSLVLLTIFAVNAVNKIPYIKGHLFEITHQYKGVLDYTIPFIQQNFKNPEDLIIATNYEEFAYMYYLGSKVTIGHVYNNLEDDLKYTPDIVSYRASWGDDPHVFQTIMQNATYKTITFPVYDYWVNNIPELDFTIKHLFRTKYASNDPEMARLYVRLK